MDWTEVDPETLDWFQVRKEECPDLHMEDDPIRARYIKRWFVQNPEVGFPLLWISVGPGRVRCGTNPLKTIDVSVLYKEDANDYVETVDLPIELGETVIQMMNEYLDRSSKLSSNWEWAEAELEALKCERGMRWMNEPNFKEKARQRADALGASEELPLL